MNGVVLLRCGHGVILRRAYSAPMTQTPTVKTPIPVVTTAEADAYMATTLRGTAWLAIPPADRDLLVVEAQRWLAPLCPNPDAEGCCGVFADRWVAAVGELAMALKLSPGAVISGAASAGGPAGEVKRQKLGDLEQEFFQARANEAVIQTSRYGVKAPLVLQAFPWLGDLIGCWLPSYGGGSGGVINRYRS